MTAWLVQEASVHTCLDILFDVYDVYVYDILQRQIDRPQWERAIAEINTKAAETGSIQATQYRLFAA